MHILLLIVSFNFESLTFGPSFV